MVDEEQAKLSEALDQGDAILVASLKRDERRRRIRLFASGLILGLSLSVIVLFVTGQYAKSGYRPSAAQLDILNRSLEQFRRVLVEYELGFDSVFPNRKPAGRDPDRLKYYPASNAWPNVVGFVQPVVFKYQFVPSDDVSTVVSQSRSGVCLVSPLVHPLFLDGYTTVMCTEGIGKDGVITAKSYASVIVKGEAAGRLLFNSYATLFIDGDSTGAINGESYFAAVITGKATGRIKLGSYAMVYILGGFDGHAELSKSTLFLGGRITKEQLQRINGTGRVFVEESDLPKGTHKLDGITVYVGQRIDARATGSAASSQP